MQYLTFTLYFHVNTVRGFILGLLGPSKELRLKARSQELDRRSPEMSGPCRPLSPAWLLTTPCNATQQSLHAS